MVAHYLTIPFKVVGIALLSWLHKLQLRYKSTTYVCLDQQPNKSQLETNYKQLSYEITKDFIVTNKGLLYKTNPDHQALRHGSASWSLPQKDIINGLIHFFQDGEVIRGHTSPYTAPPAMPMSIAHGIMSGLHLNLNEELLNEFVKFVDKKIACNFQQESDTSTIPRLKSNGFDAIFALSLLYTAYAIKKDELYLKEANKILFLKGYALLLLAPLTYISEKKRNYFLDHIAIFGLRTAILGCPNPFIKELLKRSMKFILSQSDSYTNPYFAAMAHEVGALSEEQRLKVLDVHANADVLRAARHRGVVYTSAIPTDYSTHSADEFLFDELHGQGQEIGVHYNNVPLNGLCLAKSLLILMEKK